MPLALSDDELAAIMDAAKPLQPHQRDQFLREVADELAKHELIGPGIVSRVASRLQRQHLTAPRYMQGTGKWDR